MKTLGGLELPPDMIWVDTGHAAGRKSVMRTTLMGEARIFSARQPRRILLSSGDDHGWFDLSGALAALALPAASDSALLVWQDDFHGNEALHVAFDHENGAAVKMTPIYVGASFFTGQIALIIID